MSGEEVAWVNSYHAQVRLLFTHVLMSAEEVGWVNSYHAQVCLLFTQVLMAHTARSPGPRELE